MLDTLPLLHVDYPHAPGYLYDCLACEHGPCQCTDEHGRALYAPCVSAECWQQRLW